MSYILDALRRADAERERGAVPGLHAQNIPADVAPAARDFRPLAWAAGGAAALAVAVVALLVFSPWREPPAPAAPPAIARDDGTAAKAEAPAPRSVAPAPTAMPAEPPAARVAPNRAPNVEAPIAAARAVAPPAVAARVASQAAEGRVAVLAPKPVAGKTATPPDTPAIEAPAPVEHYGAPLPAPAPAPANPNAIVALADLPPATRATLPKLSVGGAIYSDSAPARMLILNGQIYHEGDKPAADTVLEQIRHKSAVLNFRGLRYEIAF